MKEIEKICGTCHWFTEDSDSADQKDDEVSCGFCSNEKSSEYDKETLSKYELCELWEVSDNLLY